MLNLMKRLGSNLIEFLKGLLFLKKKVAKPTLTRGADIFNEIDQIVGKVAHLTSRDGKRFKRAVRWLQKNQGTKKNPPSAIQGDLQRLFFLKREFFQPEVTPVKKVKRKK